MPACSIPGCNGVYEAAGLCQMHYRRRLRHGDPLYVKPKVTWVLADCWSPGPADQCWPWLGYVCTTYGGAKFRGKSAARLVYAQLRGPVTADQILEHTCQNKLCVNPDHVRPTTRSEARSRRNRGG